MSENLITINEITKEFDCEWILVGDPVYDEHSQVVEGKLLSHSKIRDEVYAKASEYYCNNDEPMFWIE